MNIIKSLLLTLLTVSVTVSSYAQQPGYANQEQNSTSGSCLACDVDNPTNAVDGNLNTFSQLNLDLGAVDASVQQRLLFPFVGKTGDVIVLTLGTSDTADVSTLTNIRLRTFNGASANNDETQFNGSNVSAVQGTKFEYRFTASNAFTAIQLQLSTEFSGLASTLRIYAAVDERVAVDSGLVIMPCFPANTSTEGVNGNCTACDVLNLRNAHDGVIGTFSELRVGIPAPGAGVYQNLFWDDEACGVDSVKLSLSSGGGADLSTLIVDPMDPQADDGVIKVAAIDISGNIIAGTEVTVNSGSLSATQNNFVYNFIYAPISSLAGFYGVRVTFAGFGVNVDGAGALRINETCLMRFQPPATEGSRLVTACYNSIRTFTVVPSPNTTAYWYATNNPSNFENDAIYVGSTFDPSSNNPGFKFTKDTTFYFFGRNVDKDCFSLEYDSVFVDVFEELDDAIQLDIETCYGSVINFFPQALDPIYNLYEDLLGTRLIQANAQSFEVGPILNDTTFYVQTTNEAGCVSANIVPINVNLKEELFFAEVDSVINACIGEDVTVSITNPIGGVTYNWYDAALEGTNIFTGIDYTFTLNSNTNLYIDAVSNAGGCDSSAFRKNVKVNAVAKPTLTSSNTVVLVCPNDSVSIIGSSSAGDVVWYDAATEGNILFTGNSYMVYDDGGTQVFYAEAKNDRCSSGIRVAYTVVSTTDILSQLQSLSTSVCDGENVTITAPLIADITFSFWDSALSGVQIGNGSSIDFVNFVKDTTFYVQIDQANCTSAINNRTAVNLKVTSIPEFTLTNDKAYGCLNDFVVFNVDTPNVDFTYSWFNDQGALVATGSTFSAEITADTLTFFAQVGEGLCVNKLFKEVNAYKGDDLLNPIVNGDVPIQICVGDGVNITATSAIPNGIYKWYTDSVGGTLISTGANFQLDGPINRRISYWVQVQYQNICGDGLSERVEAFVEVLAKKADPVLSCGESGTDFVTFEWDLEIGTSEYVLNVDNGVDIVVSASPRSYVVSGIAPDQTVEIKVRRRGILPCQESSQTSFTCTSKACAFDVIKPVFVPASQDICAGESYTFQLDTNTVPNGDYAVTFTNTNSEAVDNLQNVTSFAITENNGTARTYLAPTGDAINYIYQVIFEMLDQPGCETQIVTRNLQLTVNPVPNVKFIAMPTIPSVVGQFINTFVFNNLTAGTIQEDWNFGDGNSETYNYTDGDPNPPNPVAHTYNDEGVYRVQLTVTNAFGCEASAFLEKDITVSTVPEIFIPNTFTPNGDLNNDRFRVFGENIELKSLKVYNQYGNEVFRGADLEAGWDGIYEGEEQPSGVFAYTAVIEDFLGNTYNREGTVTLIRK